MKINEVYSQIEKKKKELDELEKRAKEYEASGPAIQLATRLHDKLCHWNHTDGCGWYYEKGWQGGQYSAKRRYLESANRLLRDTGLSVEQIMWIIEVSRDGAFKEAFPPIKKETVVQKVVSKNKKPF